MMVDTDPPPAPYSLPAGPGIASRPADAMAPRWYAVAVSPGKLSLAERSIRAEGFETWVPLVAELDAAKRRRDLPMFPGYVLTAWADGDDWGRIVRAYGV